MDSSRRLRSGANGTLKAKTKNSRSKATRSRNGEQEPPRAMQESRMQSNKSVHEKSPLASKRQNESGRKDANKRRDASPASPTSKSTDSLPPETVPVQVRLTPLPSPLRQNKLDVMLNGGSILTDNLFERIAELTSPTDSFMSKASGHSRTSTNNGHWSIQTSESQLSSNRSDVKKRRRNHEAVRAARDAANAFIKRSMRSSAQTDEPIAAADTPAVMAKADTIVSHESVSNETLPTPATASAPAVEPVSVPTPEPEQEPEPEPASVPKDTRSVDSTPEQDQPDQSPKRVPMNEKIVISNIKSGSRAKRPQVEPLLVTVANLDVVDHPSAGCDDEKECATPPCTDNDSNMPGSSSFKIVQSSPMRMRIVSDSNTTSFNAVNAYVNTDSECVTMNNDDDSLHEQPESDEERRLLELLQARLPTATVCTCREESGWSLKAQTGVIKCDAVDSIESRPMVFCTRPVRTLKLVRAGPSLPCITMCDEHLARLANHECCPTCGFFCTVGEFYECVGFGQRGSVHLCHRNCRRFLDGQHHCPHCWLTNCMSLAYLSKPPSVELRDVTLQRVQNPKVTVTHSESGSCDASRSSRRHRSNARLSLAGTSVPPATSSTAVSAADKFETSSVTSRQSDAGSSTFRTAARAESAIQLPMPVCADPESVRRAVNALSAYVGDSRTMRVTATSLFRDARAGDAEKVLSALAAAEESYVNTPCAAYGNQTPLHAACASGNLLVVGCLVVAGARLDAVDARLATPLHAAVAGADSPRPDVARYLIACGADASSRDAALETPVHVAAKRGLPEMCAALFDETASRKGARAASALINATDRYGYTALAWAAEKDHFEVVRVLLARGADPATVDLEGNAPLHWAASTGAVRCLRLLLDFMPATLSPPNTVGDTPLHIAVRRDERECALVLLYGGANPRAKNKKGETPLVCAVDKTGELQAQLLLFQTFAQLGADRAIAHASERIVSANITYGREALPISAVNGVDDDPAPSDFRYITRCLESVPLNVNSSIASLSSCECTGDCRIAASCVCTHSSIRCWYDETGRLIDTYEFDRPPILFECSEACSCAATCGNRVVQRGIRCRLQLFKTRDRGWAVRTLQDVPRGTFVCEYVGEIISDAEANRRKDDVYLFDLDDKESNGYTLDARRFGNVARFINHRCDANLAPIKVFAGHQDLRFPRICLFAVRDICALEELGYDYGPNFWMVKCAQFTCACSARECRYSRDKLAETAEHLKMAGQLSPTFELPSFAEADQTTSAR